MGWDDSSCPACAQAASGALPAPVRMSADPRFTGRGVTVAQIDSGYFPHPDLIEPVNRIKAWAETTRWPIRQRRFASNRPEWPEWNGLHDWQWHGLMTTVAAFGNGRLSQGLYRGIASGAQLVCVQTRDRRGRISNATLTRALRWILYNRRELEIRIVSISVGGDPVRSLADNPVDRAVQELVEAGVIVVAAAGNSGERRLLPPASSPEAITVGGLDDRNVLDRACHQVWRSNYGATSGGQRKPEVIAPSLGVVAPVLPGSRVAKEAAELFARRAAGDESVEGRIAELKLVTPDYQYAEGTSFAAPLIAAVVACMLEANPALSPWDARRILMEAAYRAPGGSADRQGAGAVDAGAAVSLALEAGHARPPSPRR